MRAATNTDRAGPGGAPGRKAGKGLDDRVIVVSSARERKGLAPFKLGVPVLVRGKFDPAEVAGRRAYVVTTPASAKGWEDRAEVNCRQELWKQEAAGVWSTYLELPGWGPDPADWAKAGGTCDQILAALNQDGIFIKREKAAPPAPEIADGSCTTPKVIYLKKGRRRELQPQLWDLLNDAGGVFYRSGDLVRIIRYQENDRKKIKAKIANDTPVIFTFEPTSLSTLISRHADFFKFDGRKNDWGPADFPETEAKALIPEAYESGLPILRGIISTPTIKPDGSLLSSPGYDEDTGLFFDPCGVDFQLGLLPTFPTIEKAIGEAKLAIGVLGELLAGFPFFDETDEETGELKSASRSAALATLITAVIRPTLDAAPMLCVSAPVGGSGKSYLCKVISRLRTGREASEAAPQRNADEFDKYLDSLYMAGLEEVVLDNFDGDFGSKHLESFLTSGDVRLRTLGKSGAPPYPNTTLLMLNGNNVRLRGQLPRRSLYCSLDAEMERPDAREFTTDDPMELLHNDRPKYVRAALTVILACNAAKEMGEVLPTPERWNGFDDFSDKIRVPLIWSGERDPFSGREAMDEMNPDDKKFRALLATWWAVLKPTEEATRTVALTAGELKKAAAESETLHDAFMEVCPSKDGSIKTASLGRYLSSKRRKVAEFATKDNLGDLKEKYKLSIKVIPTRAKQDAYSVIKVSICQFTQMQEKQEKQELILAPCGNCQVNVSDGHADTFIGEGKRAPASPASPASRRESHYLPTGFEVV